MSPSKNEHLLGGKRRSGTCVKQSRHQERVLLSRISWYVEALITMASTKQPDDTWCHRVIPHCTVEEGTACKEKACWLKRGTFPCGLTV